MKIIVPAVVLLGFVVATLACTSGNTDEQGKNLMPVSKKTLRTIYKTAYMQGLRNGRKYEDYEVGDRIWQLDSLDNEERLKPYFDEQGKPEITKVADTISKIEINLKKGWKATYDYNKELAEKQKGSDIVWQTDYSCNGNCDELQKFLDSMHKAEQRTER